MLPRATENSSETLCSVLPGSSCPAEHGPLQTSTGTHHHFRWSGQPCLAHGYPCGGHWISWGSRAMSPSPHSGPVLPWLSKTPLRKLLPSLPFSGLSWPGGDTCLPQYQGEELHEDCGKPAQSPKLCFLIRDLPFLKFLCSLPILRNSIAPAAFYQQDRSPLVTPPVPMQGASQLSKTSPTPACHQGTCTGISAQER